MSSFIGHHSHDLAHYDTIEEVEELIDDLGEDISILNGYLRGAREKLAGLEQEDEEAEADGEDES